MRQCMWCDKEVEDGPCSNCMSIIRDRPIPKSPDDRAQQLHKLCQYLQRAASRIEGLEVEQDVILDRLTKLVGRPPTIDEILNKPEALEAEMRGRKGESDLCETLAKKFEMDVSLVRSLLAEYEGLKQG